MAQVKGFVSDRAGLMMLFVVYLSFIALGLPSGMFGVAQPSILKDFNIGEDKIGTLLLAGSIGYMIASFNSGRLINNMGAIKVIALSCVVAAVGLVGFALSQGWLVLIFMNFLAGIGGGTVDSSVNTYTATHYNPRVMSGLHACFGIGATIGPLITTALLDLDQSWRWGYVIAAMAWGLVTFGYVANISRDKDDQQAAAAATDIPLERVRTRDTLKMPLVWLCLALFAIYAGLEVAAGNWIFTLFTEARNIDDNTAGILTSLYWGSLTVGRITFGIGFLFDKLSVNTVMRACIFTVFAGALMLWLNPINAVSYLGVFLLGFSQAPVFPALISETPRRVGNAHTANTIGFQVAAAGVGVALIPGLVGILVRQNDAEIISIFLVLNAIVLIGIHEMVVRYDAVSRFVKAILAQARAWLARRRKQA